MDNPTAELMGVALDRHVMELLRNMGGRSIEQTVRHTSGAGTRRVANGETAHLLRRVPLWSVGKVAAAHSWVKSH